MYCQLETLRRCLPARIEHALEELPESLDGTYERILLGIEKERREFAHRLFQCLTVAVRPLRVDELAGILAIRFYPGQLPQYHVAWQLDDAQEAVLSTCSSLLSVVNLDGLPVVEFSHFSVKEFLTSERLAKSTEDLSRFHVVPYVAHTVIALASLSVLLHLGNHADKDSVKKFSFAQYAAQYWVDHGRFETVSSGIQNAMEHLFDVNEPSFATWIWIYNIDYPFRQRMFEDCPLRPEAGPLYYATLCGFRDLVEYLIAKYPGNINARGGRHGSAVNAALVKRNVEIALLLLGHGADVNITDANGRGPLNVASESGRYDHVELLLKHHADVNLADAHESSTALSMAALVGEVEIARVLLHYGASADHRDDGGQTPLSTSSRFGHLDIVRLLIQSGAAMDISDNKGWTPLFSASRYGYLDIVQLLIQSGAAVDIPDNEGRTPLKVASAWGFLDIVQLLIYNGAAVDGPDNAGCTPLFSASEYGQPDIVQLLIQSGGVVDAPDNQGWTPLTVASRNGHFRIAHLLIDHGASINFQSANLSTPLHHASVKGHFSVVELLINYHADVCKWDKDQQTPLHWAVAEGQLDVARLLLKSGSSPSCQDINGSIPLHTAALNGRLDLVNLLVEFGADADIPNVRGLIPLDVELAGRKPEVSRYLANQTGVIDSCDGIVINQLDKTPDNPDPDATLTSVSGANHRHPYAGINTSSLHDACAQGSVEDVQSLLALGADIKGRDANHDTALIVASANGMLDVMKVLIKYGADVNCQGKTGWTPLILASRDGHRDIAELLLDHGADANAKEEDLWTPLHFASSNGHLEIVKDLLHRGADPHTRNIDGRTPSGLASRTGGRDIVRLLSGVNVKSLVVYPFIHDLFFPVILMPFLSM